MMLCVQVQCTPSTLAVGIQAVHERQLLPYEAGNASGIVQAIDELFVW